MRWYHVVAALLFAAGLMALAVPFLGQEAGDLTLATTRLGVSPEVADARLGLPMLFSALLSAVLVALALVSLPVGVGLSLAATIPIMTLSNLRLVNTNFSSFHWVLLAFATVVVRRKARLARAPGALPALAYAAYCVAQIPRGYDLYDAVTTCLSVVAMLLALYVIVPRLTAEQFRSSMLIGVVGSAAVCALVLAHGIQADDIDRLGGSWFLNPNALGHAVVLPLLFYLEDILAKRGSWARAAAAVLVLGVICLALALTGSRGAVFAAAAGLLVVAARATARVWPVIVVAAMLGWALVSLTETHSVSAVGRYKEALAAETELEARTSGRLSLGELAVDVFREAPVFGVGTCNYRVRALERGYQSARARVPIGLPTHNILLSILAEQGVVGLVFYGWWLVSLVGAALRSWSVSRFPLAGLVSFILGGLATGVNLTPELGFMLGAGLLYVVEARRGVTARPGLSGALAQPSGGSAVMPGARGA